MTKLESLLEELREDIFSEVWEKGKLKSGMPLGLRRCVADVAKKNDGDTSKVFAICTASLQKAGVLKKGTHKLTKKGRKRTSSKYSKNQDIQQKDMDYETLLAMSRGEK